MKNTIFATMYKQIKQENKHSITSAMKKTLDRLMFLIDETIKTIETMKRKMKQC